VPVRPIPLPDRQKVGYDPNYFVPRLVPPIQRIPLWKRIKTEERIGSLVFWGGVIWAVDIATKDISNLFHLLLTPGPLEVSAIGLLVWLHAKWRRSVRIN